MQQFPRKELSSDLHIFTGTKMNFILLWVTAEYATSCLEVFLHKHESLAQQRCKQHVMTHFWSHQRYKIIKKGVTPQVSLRFILLIWLNLKPGPTRAQHFSGYTVYLTAAFTLNTCCCPVRLWLNKPEEETDLLMQPNDRGRAQGKPCID